ncbi:MAG: TrmH family RNA methyltransferase [Candidatus Nanosyncoccaceae bacterium]|jgi:TrmH family RNA methyltransferase
MEEISSARNTTFKVLLKLAKRRDYRREKGLIIFDGVKIVKDYLINGGRPKILIFNKSKLDKIDLPPINPEVRQIVLTASLFNRISQVEESSGLVCVTKLPESSYDVVSSKSKLGTVLLLEQVQDPGNLGAIFRSCLAFDVSTVFLSSGSVDVWSPKVIRSSAGANFALNIYSDVPLGEIISKLRSIGYQILATSPSAQKSIQSIDFTEKKVAWLFGNEGRGLSDSLMNQADDNVLIPQSSQLESLNLATSVAVCLYEQSRHKNI